MSGRMPVVELPPDARAARLARAHVRRRARAVLSPDALEDAVLLVSEVVTNAVLHGAPPITLLVASSEDPSCVRVSVTDCEEGHPAVRDPDMAAASGRGMAVVARVAHRWGVERLPDGSKRVWFDICAGAGS